MQKTLLDTKPQFTGHETFPLRQLWLKKAFDAIKANEPDVAPRTVFSGRDAISAFGVGRNMVKAIRHWSVATNIIEEKRDHYKTTELGDFIFAEDGIDPYIESINTIWLIHWKLAAESLRSTTWYWLFNHVTEQIIDRDNLLDQLISFVNDIEADVSKTTIKRDLDCCLRSYVPNSGMETPEEASESVLGELGLLRLAGKGKFEFIRGPKNTLNDAVFAYALLKFWELHETSTANTMSFETVTHDYRSPGRVFKLDEDSIAEKLANLEQISNGKLIWSDSAGVRQIIRVDEDIDSLDILRKAYE